MTLEIAESNSDIMTWLNALVRHSALEVPCISSLSAMYFLSVNALHNYLPNFFKGSDLFLPPRPPKPPLPLPPLPRPRPLPLADSFLNGTKPFCLTSTASVSSVLPGTGAIRGRRYLGTCFMCGWTRVGCNGLSCRRYSRSSGLSSKCA